MKPTKQAIELAIAQNEKVARKIKTQAALGNIKEWGHVAHYGPLVPGEWGARPCSYPMILAFLHEWVATTEERMVRLFTATVEGGAQKLKIDKSAPVWRIGSVTLFPEQGTLANAMYEARDPYVYCVDEPGAGKTYAMLGVIDRFIKSGILDRPEHIWRLAPIQIYSPATVCEQTARVIADGGYGHLLGRKIHINSYNFLQTKTARGMMWKDIENLQTGAYEIQWQLPFEPLLLLLDEAHRLTNPEAEITRILLPIMGKTKTLGFTATPADVIEKLKVMLVANRVQFDGITATDMVEADKIVKRFDATPHLPNASAMERIRSAIVGRYQYSMPKVKWDHRARTRNITTDFATDKDRSYYGAAMERYRDKCAKLRKQGGKNTRFEKAIATNEFRRAVEPLRVPFLVERVLYNWKSGRKCTGIGVAFKETMVQMAFKLDEANFPLKEQCAFVWGGVKRFRPELVYSKEEMARILQAVAARPFDPVPHDVQVRLTESIRYWEDRVINGGETEAEQTARHKRLDELGLFGSQTKKQRQRQIDKFQQGAGCSLVIFTLAAGGTGLSFHHNSLRQLPREAYFTPTYNGPEIKQALGRFARRTSLSDTDQYLCWMAGTVEETEVAPRIDEKLHCLAKLTNRNFDITDLLDREFNPLAKGNRLLSFEEIQALENPEDNNVVVDTGDDDVPTDMEGLMEDAE